MLSVIMPVLNEEANLPRVLGSLVAQNLPKAQLEIIVADAGSTDGTRDVLRSFSDRLDIQIVDNSGRRWAEWGKARALEVATGELTLCLDADMWLPNKDCLLKLSRPLLADPDLAGGIAPYAFDSALPLWSRYLSCDELQRDPLIQALTPPLMRFVVERRAGYVVCEFPGRRIPPFGGTTMYRRSSIDLDRWGGFFNELDHPAYLISSGSNRFAFVQDAGVVHDHCDSLRELVSKRRRNLLGMANSYLVDPERRDFVWIDVNSREEVVRAVAFVVGAHLLIPELIRGAIDAVSRRHWEALLRPVAAVAVADGVVGALIGSRSGRRFICSAVPWLRRFQ